MRILAGDRRLYCHFCLVRSSFYTHTKCMSNISDGKFTINSLNETQRKGIGEIIHVESSVKNTLIQIKKGFVSTFELLFL